MKPPRLRVDLTFAFDRQLLDDPDEFGYDFSYELNEPEKKKKVTINEVKIEKPSKRKQLDSSTKLF